MLLMLHMLCYKTLENSVLKKYHFILYNFITTYKHTHTKHIYLFIKTAAGQVMIFSLETLGFSQDSINLIVDHAGHLMR